jgi:hypothetical protein
MPGMERYIPRMPRDDEPVPADLDLHCTSCGYSLTGLFERRCPECGEPFDPRETWLENERSTWQYHFENVRSKTDYVRLGYLLVTVLFYFALVCVDVRTLLALPLVVAGEMYILWTGGPGTRIRMDYWTVCAAWGVVAALVWRS